MGNEVRPPVEGRPIVHPAPRRGAEFRAKGRDDARSDMGERGLGFAAVCGRQPPGVRFGGALPSRRHHYDRLPRHKSEAPQSFPHVGVERALEVVAQCGKRHGTRTEVLTVQEGHDGHDGRGEEPLGPKDLGQRLLAAAAISDPQPCRKARAGRHDADDLPRTGVNGDDLHGIPIGQSNQASAPVLQPGEHAQTAARSDCRLRFGEGTIAS